MLSARYKALHCVGAALCLASLGLFVYIDSSSSEASDVVLGDGLVIMGAMLYAACNVTQEKLLREPSCPCPDRTPAQAPGISTFKPHSNPILKRLCAVWRCECGSMMGDQSAAQARGQLGECLSPGACMRCPGAAPTLTC